MLNPIDLENKTMTELKKSVPEEFLKENTNGKGDDEDGSNTKVH